MAQLTDDCFAFNGPLLPVAEAEQLIAARVNPVSGRQSVPLREALGRVLAADIIAPVNLPPFDNSAVDGYAVRGEDIDAAREQRLAIVDRVAAGHAATHAIKFGEAVRIFTGAPMPPGADTVFMQEDCRIDGAHVIVPPGLSRGANRRLAGEDIRAGAVALPAGRRLSAQDIALAAALDRDRGEAARASRAVFDRRRDRRAGLAARRCGALRFQPLSARRGGRALWRRGHRSRHSSR
jgi:molybdopterin molybdotransferase